MAIQFTGIEHVSLRSKNYKEQEKFYTQILELTKAFDTKDEHGNIISTFFRLPNNQFVELYHSGSDPEDQLYVGENLQSDRSHYHLCLEIDARHEAYRDMDRKNVSVFRAPDDSVGMCGSWCSFIRDKEGNEWELMEFSPISKQLIGEEITMKFHD